MEVHSIIGDDTQSETSSTEWESMRENDPIPPIATKRKIKKIQIEILC